VSPSKYSSPEELARAGRISGIFAMATFWIFIPVFGGFVWNWIPPVVPADDVDCQASGPLDERGPDCYKHCVAGHVWWGLGHRQECYWDDDPEPLYPETKV
jgi:hypothetical protein